MLTPPPVAVTVREEIPAATVDAAETVRVRLPLPGAGILVAMKFAVNPLKRPLTDSVMAALKPACLATDKTMEPALPAGTLIPAGVGVNVNVGAEIFRMNDKVR